MKQKFPIEDRLCETVVLLISSALGMLGCFVSLVTCWTNGCLNAQLEHEMVQRTGKTNLLPYTMWGSDNNIWDVQKCEPCCGEPCNPVDGAYCCMCPSLAPSARVSPSSLWPAPGGSLALFPIQNLSAALQGNGCWGV